MPSNNQREITRLKGEASDALMDADTHLQQGSYSEAVEHVEKGLQFLLRIKELAQ